MPQRVNMTLRKAGHLLVRCAAKLWFRSALLLLVFILMVFLFSNNDVWLKSDHKPSPAKDKQFQLNAGAKELIAKEHEQALNEIKMSLEQMDTWYHYKFILIGGVIAVFLGNIGILRRQGSVSRKESERLLESALMSNRTAAMLTLVCVIAFIIDMHIRSTVNGIQLLGLWIANYVEPSYLNSAGVTTTDYPNSVLAEIGFIPWETFLRLPRTTGSTLYPVIYSIQLHFTTILSYLLYVMVFQNISLISRRGRRQQIAVVGFLSVHLSLFAFIVVAHTVRNIFNVACFPMVPRDLCWLSGTRGSAYYLIVWLLLVVINMPYLLVPILRTRTEAAEAG